MRNSRSSLVFVERSDILDEIVEDSNQKRHKSLRVHENKMATAPSDHLSTDYIRKQYLVKCQQEDSLTRQNIKKSIENRTLRKDEKFMNYLDDIDQCNSFVSTLDKSLNLFDEAQKNKTRRQFEDWNENVHGKIQMKIAKQVNSLDAKQLNKLKNEDYSKFLDISNKKAAIFRDIIIESEYDPLEPNRRAFRAKTGMLNDPTHIDQIKLRKESQMLDVDNEDGGLSRSASLKKKINTREVLAVELWAAGKIEGTPYGTFAKLMDESHHDHKQTKTNPTIQSSIHFDDFNFKSGKEVLDAEMPRGKRIFPQQNYPFGFCSSVKVEPEEHKSRLKHAQNRLNYVMNEGPNSP